ncbi:MAG: transposase, partial [Thermodesulfobacterium geofontis]
MAIQIDVKSKIKRKRKPIYDEKVKKALINLWKISYFPCGKRLKAILPKIIPKLKFFNEFTFEKEVEEKLLKISAATIDRILSSEKEKLSLKERSKTK